MNKVILIGRLSRDPELRTTPNNLSVATFSLAVSRPYTPQGGNPETDFINCVVWRRQAENLARYCHKGSQIAVEGRIQTRNYTAQDGSRRYVTEILCDTITFLGSKADNQGNTATFVDNSYPAPNYPQPDFGGQNYGAQENYEGPQKEGIVDTPVDNNYNPGVPTTDITEDPFKDFGEEITLSDDDLPF